MATRFDTKYFTVPLRRRIFSFPTLLSFGVAIMFIYFLASRFDIDWTTTWDNVRSMNPWAYGMALVLYYVSFIFRGIRWRILTLNAGLHDDQTASLPSVLRFSQIIVIGWFVNGIAWLRFGDAYRSYAFSEDSGRDFSWSLGTVLAERVVDMVTVLVLLVLGIGFFSISKGMEGPVYLLVSTLFMAVVLGLMLLLMKGYGVRFARLLPARLESAYSRFHEGTLGSLKRLKLVFLLGLFGWLLEAGRFYFVVEALDLSIGLPLVLIVSLGHAVLSTVPTPGGVGAVEPGMTTLLLLELSKMDASSVTLLDRSITYLSVIVFGGLFFLAWNMQRSRRHYRSIDGASTSAGSSP